MINYLSKNFLLIPICVISLAFGITKLYKSQYSQNAIALKNSIQLADSIQQITIDSKHIKNNNLEVIYSQYNQVKLLKMPYLNIAITYYSYGLAFASMLIYFSVLSGISAFLIVKRGWDDTSILLKAFALTFIFGTSVYGIFPNVFKNNENTAKNLTRFKNMHVLQYNIYNNLNKQTKLTNEKIDTLIELYNSKIPLYQEYLNEIDISSIPISKGINELNSNQ